MCPYIIFDDRGIGWEEFFWRCQSDSREGKGGTVPHPRIRIAVLPRGWNRHSFYPARGASSKALSMSVLGRRDDLIC
jgi:hypothetical protein